LEVEPEVSADPVRAPDEADMDEATAGAIDPTDLIVDLLGGEVVE
jgi:hypothetical protein